VWRLAGVNRPDCLLHIWSTLDHNGGLIKLFDEDVGIQVGRVVNMLLTPIDLLGGDHLGDLEDYPVTFL